jgi:phosphoserine phosphatase RsbU/P
MNSPIKKNSPLILVADDDSSTRILLRLILENDGYQVAEVENGEQCVAIYTQQKPDMVLLDAMMPVMDGFTCCRQLKSLSMGDRTPVLMITGLDDQDSVDLAFAVGAIDYVTKPIHPPVLSRRLRRILETIWAEEALRESEKKYRSVVTSLKEVIFQTDTNGKFTFLNPAWTKMTGFAVEKSLGRNFSEFIYSQDNFEYLNQFQKIIQRQTEESRFEIRNLTHNGGFSWIRVYAYPLLTDDGNMLGISGTLNDITERKRREQYQRAEYVVAQILAESATIKEAAPKILQAICESLGWDFGEFWSLNESKNIVNFIETWSCKSDKFLELKNFIHQLICDSNSISGDCIWAIKESNSIVNLAKDNNFSRAEIATQSGLKVAFGFPLLSKGENLGIAIFYSRENQQSDAELIELVGTIGHQISQFIKRKQAEEELQRQNLILQWELNQAAEYVRSLLPSPLSKIVTVEQQFIPSLQLGGDIFDYYWLDDDRLVIYLLDVAGHGVRSALLSISILNLLRSQALYNTNFYSPCNVLSELNRICQLNENGDDYLTMWYGVYDRVKRSLVYASAGHPPAILISNSAVKELSTPNIPIGMFPDIDFIQDSYEISPGSSLYIFSDGVYEILQPNGEIWGLDAFVDLIVNCPAPNQVLDKIQNLNGNQSLNDDFSLLKITFA